MSDEVVIKPTTHLWRQVIAVATAQVKADGEDVSLRAYVDSEKKIDFTFKKSLIDNTRPFVIRHCFPPMTQGVLAQVMYSDNLKMMNVEILGDDVTQYNKEMFYPFADVTFKDTVNLSLYLDGNPIQLGEQGMEKVLTSSDTTTDRVYIPMLRGHIPQLIYKPGEILLNYAFTPVDPQSYVLRQLFHSALVTYWGDPTIAFGLDGNPMPLENGAQEKAMTLTPFYQRSTRLFFKPGTMGIVPEYRKVRGTGKIIAVNYDSEKAE